MYPPEYYLEHDRQKIFRQIGSLAFVLGLFFAIFTGIPWYVIISDDPAMPWWLKIALFSTLGGIVAVLLTVALEQRKTRKPDAEEASTEPGRAILMLNSWYTSRLSNSVTKSYCKNYIAIIGSSSDISTFDQSGLYLPQRCKSRSDSESRRLRVKS